MILSGYLGVLLRQKTDAEGKFVFLLRKHVTVTNSDTFCLYGYTPLDETADYLPTSGYPGETFLLKCNFDNYDISMNFIRFDPQKDNLTNFEYLVDPIIQTHFSGVVTKSGVPVENAKVAVFSSRASHKSMDIFEGNDVTDRNGNFNVTVRGRESNYVFEDGIVIASIERSSYTVTKDNKGEDSSFELSPIAIATGSKEIQFKSGDTISNINIEISEESTCEVQGVIDNINEFSFDDIVIEFEQNDRRYQVDLDPSGSFSMKGLNPGVAYLSIRPGRRIIDHPKYGSQQNGDFIYQYIRLTIPDNEKTLFVEVKLLKAGYLAGIAMDANRRVVENAIISTTNFDNRNVGIQTKADGLFWIPNLYLNHTYTLTAVKDNLHATIENIQPSDENIILILQ